MAKSPCNSAQIPEEVLSELEQTLGHSFASPQLLMDALTHPSLSSGYRKKKTKTNKASSPYERLEFLGDRVLGLAIADMLLHAFPDEPEGDLAMRFTGLVSQEPLAEIATELGLGRAILLNAGTVKENGRANASILSDTCEAVIGAMYLDAGFDVAKKFVNRIWVGRLHTTVAPPKDAKNALQEWAQGRGLPLPKYTVLSQEGPSHAPTFDIQVEVLNHGKETAQGGSKRTAEQAAAAALMARLAEKDS